MLAWTQCWPQSDSLKLYSAPKWKLWRLIQAYERLPVCDSALTAAHIALQAKDTTIARADEGIEKQAYQIKLKEEETKYWSERFDNQVKKYEVERKEERNRRRSHFWRVDLPLVGISIIELLVIISMI